MRTGNIRCDYCKKLTTIEGKRKEYVHGFAVELGYSSGGWGKRKDFTPPHSVEICTECFDKVEAAAQNLVNVIDQCKEDGQKVDL